MRLLLDVLIPILIAVESHGVSGAIGDNGKAVGVLQIHPILIEDVNRIYKTSYTLKDRLDRAKSIEICQLYLSYWGSRYTERTGNPVTYEVLARMWNGGGHGGYTKPSTEVYWDKVSRLLDAL